MKVPKSVILELEERLIQQLDTYWYVQYNGCCSSALKTSGCLRVVRILSSVVSRMSVYTFYCMVSRTDCIFFDNKEVFEVDTLESQLLHPLVWHEIENHSADFRLDLEFVSHNTMTGLWWFGGKKSSSCHVSRWTYQWVLFFLLVWCSYSIVFLLESRLPRSWITRHPDRVLKVFEGGVLKPDFGLVRTFLPSIDQGVHRDPHCVV